MANHFYFTFTCGNFTSGHGHIITLRRTPKDEIEQTLQSNGEKNCNVILQRRSVSGNPTGSTTHSEDMHDFSYEVTNRWHTSLTRTVLTAAPVLLPMMFAGNGSNDARAHE